MRPHQPHEAEGANFPAYRLARGTIHPGVMTLSCGNPGWPETDNADTQLPSAKKGYLDMQTRQEKKVG